MGARTARLPVLADARLDGVATLAALSVSPPSAVSNARASNMAAPLPLAARSEKPFGLGVWRWFTSKPRPGNSHRMPAPPSPAACPLPALPIGRVAQDNITWLRS